jgi:hypothetical protein
VLEQKGQQTQKWEIVILFQVKRTPELEAYSTSSKEKEQKSFFIFKKLTQLTCLLDDFILLVFCYLFFP